MPENIDIHQEEESDEKEKESGESEREETPQIRDKPKIIEDIQLKAPVKTISGQIIHRKSPENITNEDAVQLTTDTNIPEKTPQYENLS